MPALAHANMSHHVPRARRHFWRGTHMVKKDSFDGAQGCWTFIQSRVRADLRQLLGECQEKLRGSSSVLRKERSLAVQSLEVVGSANAV